ncbi:macro domain-containing protein [Brevibacillus humidisoli]|uniref:type II toxin-antitoxin system antitoxin DNA ADP-ribosyl glycohydrolase DarG n=1 Tax=Brevibacillus humidisoli TaxID=2895522 RepID=UPI001E4B58EF|nr:macro domain-containing protein [Brevibacillus humidisoli]UFJ40101.1 macro domain-containing protein [Brevibacillus humidisoli]
MIEYKRGNLLEADVEALVNTVNCVGVMGKGIALQFKQAFPDNFTEYVKACRVGGVQPGKMLTVMTGFLWNPKYIINFPTKRHWKEASRLEDIDAGLTALVQEVKTLNIKSIAIPPLGCGNGGLDWNVVRPRIENAFAPLSDVYVELYVPSGSPAPDAMKIGTKKPRMTKARALFLSLMKEYALPGYRLSLLEIQKLAYFLQEVGEELRLKFVRFYYGPYAENLNHVLQALEGHYIRGYGDRSKDAEIYVLPHAAEEAKDFLANEGESLRRLDHVKEIIRGFETPYGMELLATVHWVVKEKPGIADSPDKVVYEVHQWSPRKKRTFTESHIKKALEHLRKADVMPTTD